MNDLFDLSGQTVAVTGSSRGIGLAIASAMMASGAAVVVNGLDVTETDEAVLRLRKLHGSDDVIGVPGDVTNPTLVAHLVNTAIERFGQLSHVVCNAGIDVIKPAVEYEIEEWDRIVMVNLRGAFQVAQAAGRGWIERGQPGSITVTSSIAGSVGIPTLAPYAASKGGVNQMVRTLAVEWAPHAIRVNAIAPGYVANVMNAVTAHDDPASDQRINTFTPLGRRATPDEIAGPFVFLASKAASYVTGAILHVDGGYTAI